MAPSGSTSSIGAAGGGGRGGEGEGDAPATRTGRKVTAVELGAGRPPAADGAGPRRLSHQLKRLRER